MQHRPVERENKTGFDFKSKQGKKKKQDLKCMFYQ